MKEQKEKRILKDDQLLDLLENEGAAGWRADLKQCLKNSVADQKQFSKFIFAKKISQKVMHTPSPAESAALASDDYFANLEKKIMSKIAQTEIKNNIWIIWQNKFSQTLQFSLQPIWLTACLALVIGFALSQLNILRNGKVVDSQMTQHKEKMDLAEPTLAQTVKNSKEIEEVVVGHMDAEEYLMEIASRKLDHLNDKEAKEMWKRMVR